ncbi:hypothetical protein GCM10025868_28530 [Angustibacter aerolatus]|uniref:Carrier domain-containing protein n=1 Tax=Angustibacter aerolatus TaxID=1162965 RepID=A0ABQ6JJL3_9ACTN|nr:hypothetical protein GCM10025868_28530 [Angustibacter aerolatus]
MGQAQDLEHAVEALLTDDVADADQVAVLCGDLDGQITLRDLQDEVELVLALDRAGLDLLDQGRTVVGVHDRLADFEHHVMFSPFATTRIPRQGPPQKSRSRRLRRSEALSAPFRPLTAADSTCIRTTSGPVGGAPAELVR